VREHENEPIPGLPEMLPEGEHILWQGAPSWISLGNKALHLKGVVGYLALIVVWGAAAALARHETTPETAAVALNLCAIAFTSIAALAFYARLVARNTLYTITNRRIVMRFGVALPITMNIPLAMVESADLKIHSDGTGDIPFALTGKDRQSFVVLWPHVRPWRLTKPQPMLRCVPAAREVAKTLASALVANMPNCSASNLSASRPIFVDNDDVAVPARDTVAA
jgi:hypothetical protein